MTARAYLVGPNGKAHDQGRIFFTGIEPDDTEADARDLYLTFESSRRIAGGAAHTIYMRVNGEARDYLREQLEQADQIALIRAADARAQRARRRWHWRDLFKWGAA